MPLCPSCGFNNRGKNKFCTRCCFGIQSATDSINNPALIKDAFVTAKKDKKTEHRDTKINSMPSKNVKKGFFFRVAPFLVGLIILLSVLVGLYISLPLSELTLNRSVLVLEIGSEEDVLTASVKPDFIKEKILIWKSSDPYVAEVSNGGVVSAKDIGLATITVSTEDGIHQATCKIEVVHPTIDWNEGIYTGEIDKDIPNGYGVWITTSEESYEGYWEDGLFNGEGKHILDDGQIFAGVFVEGLLQGDGTWTNVDGDTYLGEFLAGKKHGEGVYTWADGSVFRGDYYEDMKHGLGVLVSVDGKKTEGEWANDEYIAVNIQQTRTLSDNMTVDEVYMLGYNDGYSFYKGTSTYATKKEVYASRNNILSDSLLSSVYDRGFTSSYFAVIRDNKDESE
jgi:hypothetical protein